MTVGTPLDSDDDKTLVGLDRRRRPSSMRDRIIIGLRQSAPFSSLQRRIIVFNLMGLAVLVFWVLYLNEFRSGLITERVRALVQQGEMAAIMLGDSVREREDLTGAPAALDAPRAEKLLRQVMVPTGLDAKLYDANSTLLVNTRENAPKPAEPPPEPAETEPASVIERIERSYGRLIGHGERPVDEQFFLTPEELEAAIGKALAGEISNAVYLDEVGNLVISVFVPVRGEAAVVGAIELSTESGDINQVVRRERVAIMQVFLIASLVNIGLSLLLANTIARPIRKLARAVDPEGTSSARPINPDRIEVPDMTRRTDEIGDLSAALIRMTDALYRRIEAIESFAADVAHEIKNPLTSLRSAVETMEYAKTPEQRQRLLDVIQNDVGRLDRLVTDISNASRLDAELVRERMETFDLGTLVQNLSTIAEAQGEKLGVSVVTHLPDEPLTTRGLEGRIAQVITNLTDNALSFSPEGSKITVKGSHLPHGGVRISVSDEGPGIPEENLATIFERFYSERPEASFGNHSGLGLSICRQIVDAHGGQIWAENIRPAGAGPETPPQGARFVMELPG